MNIDHFRRGLLAFEHQLMERLGDEVDTVSRPDRADPSNAGADVGDLSQVDELEDEYLALAQTDSAILAQVRAALRRIDEGTYGKCLVDGEPIDEKRLESLPWVAYCLKHQTALEERERFHTQTM